MKRWHDLILEADFPWNIDEKYCEQAEWMMLLGSVLIFADHRSCLERTFQYPPYAWNGPHVGIAFDQQRIGNASVVPDRFDTLTAARFPPIALPCACSLYMFLVQQTQYSHAM